MAIPVSRDAAHKNDSGKPVSSGVRLRVYLIGALLAAFTAYLVTEAEMVLSTLRIGFLQFPPAALGMLLILVGVNRLMKRLSRAAVLTSSDELVLYVMLLVAAIASSHGVVQKWIPLLIAPKYFASLSNNWHQLYDSHLPSWLVPFDVHNGAKQDVATWYFEKMPVGAHIPWALWLKPVLTTGVLIGLIVFSFLCLAAILRRQWVDNEKLAFPLAQLPLEITDGENGGAFFRNPIMWLGAAVPGIVYAVKAFHQMAPSVPDITLTWSLGAFVTTAPWNQVAGNIYIFLSFAAIGFFFLLPADVLLSIWFFYTLSNVECLIAASYNMAMPTMPLYGQPIFTAYQTVAANCVLVAYFVIIARPHLKMVWNAAIGRVKVDDGDELMPYRTAFWGLLISVGLSAICMWIAGMSLWLAVWELVAFIGIIAVVMARSTAEAGLMMTETTFRPIDLFRMFGSVHALGPANLTMLAFVDNLLMRDQRGLVLTGFLDGLKIADGARIRRRSLLVAFGLALAVSITVAVMANIALPYQISANRMDAWMERQSPLLTWQDYQPYFKNPDPLDHSAHWQIPVFFTVGAVVTVFLTAMRTAFYWWPLHPLGYAIAGSWSTTVYWFPCLLAWACKSVTVRYGGMPVYNKVRPFFLGLVLGEFASAVFWVILYMLWKIPPPAFPWG